MFGRGSREAIGAKDLALDMPQLYVRIRDKGIGVRRTAAATALASIPRSLKLANAADNELRAGSALDEKWEAACVWVVIGGLVLEGVVAGVHAPYDAAVTRCGSFVCDALIALGVYFELYFSSRIRQRDHELVRRSNERVAKAEERTKQLEAVSGWRELTADQHERLVNAIRSLAPSLDVLLQIQRDSAEVYTYGRQIIGALHRAGIKLRTGTNSFVVPIFGVHISVEQPIDIGSLLQIFNTSGIPVVHHDRPPSVYSSAMRHPPNTYIFVGPKPPPDFTI